jgi:uncharacterized secreted protein with C-terminal beta-propeller domain
MYQNKKAIFGVLLIIVLLFTLSPVFSSSQNIKVFFDGNAIPFDVHPIIEKDTTFVPFRSLFETYGAEVKWDKLKSTVTAVKDDTTIILTIGSRTALINGKEVELDHPVRIKKGRTLVPLKFVGEDFGLKVNWYGASRIIHISSRGTLPVVGTAENFKSLIESAEKKHNSFYKGFFRGAIPATGAMPDAMDSSKSLEAAQSGSPDYSSTNIQVEGVDEADIVKTDGKYIYQVNRDRVVIVEAYPASQMKVASIIGFNDKSFYPSEIFIDEKHMVVLGTGYNQQPGDMPMERKMMYPPIYRSSTVKIYVYNIEDKENVREIRQFEIDGFYVSSRKIGSNLYLVANKHINYYYPMEQGEGPTTPSYRDTAVSDEFIQVGFDRIQYFPEFLTPNYLIVAGINLDNNNEEANVYSYLGSSENIYVSLENLYVALTKYEEATTSNSNGVIGIPRIMPIEFDRNTQVYKFALNNGKVNFVSEGQVPGNILNQFSMDEHKGFFRIATTKGDMWRTDEHTSKNNVYILDREMKITGKVEDIAPGERIYSTRFMGDRGYMVTFRTVDPFFVIDLKDPYNPKILGELKIPGYSDYLHPYDENHIIGFGKDTIELPQYDRNGIVIDTMAFYMGVKISMFDVTDVNNPIEKFVKYIGDRGTESEVLYNHRALLFSKEKNLMAFPVTLMEVKDTTPQYPGMPPHGEFAFQGAYIYNVDLVNGFSLRSRITHISDEEYKKAGNYWYDSDKNVQRILYIGDTLYTLSNGMIKAHGMNDLVERNHVRIP